MITLRRSNQRGHASHGWLDSYHTFSFADYYDPAQMGFRVLRVINEDRIAPAQGFGTHPHKDMEILTYILAGQLSHRDSMGNTRTIGPGEVQAMSAGTGVAHSEFNPSPDQPAHLLQIWLMPDTKNVAPSYSEWRPDGSERTGWALVASPDGQEGSVTIHQDARLLLAVANKTMRLPLPLARGRYGWLQMAKGSAGFAGHTLQQGDAAAFAAGDADEIILGASAEVLLFDLP